MDKQMKYEIAKEILEHMSISKEQYEAFCGIAEDSDLVLEENWDDVEDFFK